MTGNEPAVGTANPQPASASKPWQWQWYMVLLVIVGTVDPLVDAVRKAAEPAIGHWPAWALGLLATAVVAAPIFVVFNWVFRRERLGQVDDLAAMIYRPAALPAMVFIGTILKDFPSALTDGMTWAFLGWLVVLLTGAVLIQWRRRRAWSWWMAVAAGIAISLAALLGALLVVQFVSPHGLQPG